MMCHNGEFTEYVSEDTAVQNKAMNTRDSYEDSCSRDSGIAEMDSDSPTDFGVALFKRQSSVSMKILDIEMEELVLEEGLKSLSTKECKALNGFEKRIGLSNITNSPHMTESPKARTRKFAARGIQRSQTSTFCRKRGLGDSFEEVKRRRAECIEENNEVKSDCSRLPTVSFAVPRPVPLHKVHSTSVLEKGAYAHHSADEQLPKVLEVEFHLPILPKTDSQAYRRISNTTVIELLNNMTDEEFNSKYVLIDARYPFEYEGGHMRNAINLFNPELVEDLFYPEDITSRKSIHSRIPIMYCEYSQKRGPTMAQALRAVDRKRNELAYPYVDYPEIYVVDKGYKGFFESFGESDQGACVPSSYTPMNHPKYSYILRTFSFHKTKSFGAATSIRPAMDAKARQMMRRASADSPSSRSSRRGLFMSTPERSPLPIGPLLFS